MKKPSILTTIAFLTTFGMLPMAHALETPVEELKDTVITTELGTEIDPALTFLDRDGSPITISQVLNQEKPFIVIPAYYSCPHLCGLLLSGVQRLLGQLKLEIGSDYHMLTVSFDPRDTVEAAKDAHTRYTSNLLVETASHWRFLTGEKDQTVQLMQQLGFHYKRDRDDFAHAAALFVLTPGGKISQYFTGVTFSPFDVRLALIEASEGRIGSPLDHVLLFCFRFDPTKGKYTWAVINLMRGGGALTLLFLISLVVLLRRRELRRLRTSEAG